LCKRPCFHDEYLQTFNRPNVKLVDTEGRGVERITERGAVVTGVEYPLECLIYASGFEVTTEFTRRIGFDLHGRDGVSLHEAWTEGAATLHGITSRGFPNLLLLSSIQGGQSINWVYVMNGVSQHVAYLVKRCLSEGISTIEPTTAAQDAWREVIFDNARGLAGFSAFDPDCTPGYFNNEGEGGDKTTARNAPFMGSALDYFHVLAEWRERGDLAGLQLAYCRV
jgi:cation diffusion facilitator CzcD-associated flavoprotein CzcO